MWLSASTRASSRTLACRSNADNDDIHNNDDNNNDNDNSNDTNDINNNKHHNGFFVIIFVYTHFLGVFFIKLMFYIL